MANKRAEPRKAEEILTEIQNKLATIDGIATADAFALGRMVMEYGQACAGKASSDVLTPLLGMMLEPRDKKPERPW